MDISIAHINRVFINLDDRTYVFITTTSITNTFLRPLFKKGLRRSHNLRYGDIHLNTNFDKPFNPIRQLGRKDLCFILFTSGTTGLPNGVEVTHRNLCNILLISPGYVMVSLKNHIWILLAAGPNLATQLGTSDEFFLIQAFIPM